MLLSLSASIEDASTKYAWFKYSGSRGREVSQRSHKRMIREGDVYGIMPLRSGARFTLIFPDMPHVDFPLNKADGVYLMENASKLRKLPQLSERGGKKVAGAKTLQKKLAREQFDSPRFSIKRVPSESVYGINFVNYQWRIIPVAKYQVKTSKGSVTLMKNDMIGVRFLRPNKGGIVINEQGMLLKVPDESYDQLIADSNLLPDRDWPTGTVDADTIADYMRDLKRARSRQRREASEAARLANDAALLEKTIQRKQLLKEQRKQAAVKARELKDLRAKVRSGEIEAPKGEVKTVYEDSPDLVRLPSRNVIIEHEDLDEDLDEYELDVEMEKLSDVMVRSPFAGDAVNITNSIGSLFGDDDNDIPVDSDLDSDFDLSDIDEPEDDEEEEAPAKVRPKQKAGKSKEAAPIEDEEEEDAEEDDSDSDPDADPEEDADGDESDVDSEDDSDSEEEDVAEDEEEDTEDEDDADADTSEAVDESDSDSDPDSDVAAAEDEAKKTAKKIAAQNKSTPSSRAEEAEEGDVLKFRADAKLNRDWVVLKVSTHNASDNIVVYTLYDITNSPDEVRQVRVNRARKQNLFDYAEHVKDMAPKLFNRVLDMAEDYPVNKDPIAS